jgi:ComF family protein
MREYLSRFVNMLYPKTCIGCGVDVPHDDAHWACLPCWSGISFIDGRLYCATCSKPLDYGGKYCFDCNNKRTPYVKIIAAVRYAGIIRAYVRRIKFRRQAFFIKPLAALLGNVCEKQIVTAAWDAFIPVPLHAARLRERGFNQSVELANILSDRFKIPVRNDLLYKNKNISPLYGLSKIDRQKNIAGAFAVHPRGACRMPKTVILVDDVCTTTATFHECSRLLRRAGATKVLCLALARD